jgi:hypothetical protein
MFKLTVSRLLNLLTILSQIGLTFIATICIYMVFALLDYQGGIEGIIGITVFQPIFAVLLSVLTIVVCFIVGLPIRLNRVIYRWWTDKFYISIIGVVGGVCLLFLSFSPYFLQAIKAQVEGQETIKKIPNLALVIAGWFLTAFSTLHLYPPIFLRTKLERVLRSLWEKKKND